MRAQSVGRTLEDVHTKNYIKCRDSFLIKVIQLRSHHLRGKIVNKTTATFLMLLGNDYFHYIQEPPEVFAL
jgi:hypothetical protein